MTDEEIVKAKYPDAVCVKYDAGGWVSFCVKSDGLKRGLWSDTESDAWADAARRIEKGDDSQHCLPMKEPRND